MQSPPLGAANVTASEAASILKISHRACLKAIHDGRLRAAEKLPGRTGPYLIPLTEVRRFGDERSAAQAERAAS